MKLSAPFPYFGGKSRVAATVWAAFGQVNNYVEPFFGSGAVLLGRPGGAYGVETVNDMDGLLCNAWRAIQWAPDEVAYWADWPVIENDLHARNYYCMNRRSELAERLECDPEFYDAKLAGWWIWGMSTAIAGRVARDTGPWVARDGKLVKRSNNGNGAGPPDCEVGISRSLPYLSSAGQGIHKHGVDVGSTRSIPELGRGRGVQGQLNNFSIYDWMCALSERLRRVRICCGDWERVCTPANLAGRHGLTGVFLDPPYHTKQADRSDNLYVHDDDTVADRVRAWCIRHGDNPLMRIALCGYEGEEHEVLESLGWRVYAWKANGGFANQRKNGKSSNAYKERIWFSPHCLPIESESAEQLCLTQ